MHVRLITCGLDFALEFTWYERCEFFFSLFVLFSETKVEVQESVRGQDIFIIQTIPRWDKMDTLRFYINSHIIMCNIMNPQRSLWKPTEVLLSFFE